MAVNKATINNINYLLTISGFMMLAFLINVPNTVIEHITCTSQGFHYMAATLALKFWGTQWFGLATNELQDDINYIHSHGSHPLLGHSENDKDKYHPWRGFAGKKDNNISIEGKVIVDSLVTESMRILARHMNLEGGK